MATSTSIARQPFQTLGADLQRRSREHYKRLRDAAREWLRRIVAAQQHTGATAKRGPRWALNAAEVGNLRTNIRDQLLRAEVGTPVKESALDAAVERYFAEAEWEKPSSDTPPLLGRVPLNPVLDYDESGRLVAGAPIVHSADAFVALTLCELVAEESRVQVLKCRLDNCGRFFVRDLRAQARPKMFCCDGHGSTRHSQQKRLKEKRLK